MQNNGENVVLASVHTCIVKPSSTHHRWFQQCCVFGSSTFKYPLKLDLLRCTSARPCIRTSDFSLAADVKTTRGTRKQRFERRHKQFNFLDNSGTNSYGLKSTALSSKEACGRKRETMSPPVDDTDKRLAA